MSLRNTVRIMRYLTPAELGFCDTDGGLMPLAGVGASSSASVGGMSDHGCLSPMADSSLSSVAAARSRVGAALQSAKASGGASLSAIVGGGAHLSPYASRLGPNNNNNNINNNNGLVTNSNSKSRAFTQ